ncbi:MAG: sigma-54 dependent transcriptional regulator [Pseudomonadota bacterium]|nr:sigma-54 dependent transcriptional regulator [Pseudomonadota bacterium]
MRLLIIGNPEGQIGQAGKIAHNRGATVTHAERTEQALNALRAGHGADLVMIDVRLDVAVLVEALKTERISIPVIACGIGGDQTAAVRAIRAGAREYVPLPPDSELIAAVLEAVTIERHALIHADPVMKTVIDTAEKIAPSEASVLITGESGTGKEILARAVHRKSRRSKTPFISVNCAAIPDALLESELFGHEKGSFTGAVTRRIGKFEEASGGTLLLDEIGEMDQRLQAKLLRALQEREIDRIGGSNPVKVDIRLITTTNRDLAAMVREGIFREDLYWRLNVVAIEIPPLRARPGDIAPLAVHFAAKYCKMNALDRKDMSDAALARLTAARWPGNVRELENAIHRAVLFSPGSSIEADAIITGAPESMRRSEKANPGEELVGKTVAEVEQRLILDTLEHCFGNRTHAANILGISIRTLRNKLRQYTEEGIAVPMPGQSQAALG